MFSRHPVFGPLNPVFKILDPVIKSQDDQRRACHAACLAVA